MYQAILSNTFFKLPRDPKKMEETLRVFLPAVQKFRKHRFNGAKAIWPRQAHFWKA